MKIEVWNLLEEFASFENIIRNSMMPNEREIINGVNIVREIVQGLNPDLIDCEFGNKVKIMVDKYEKRLNSQMRVVNTYTMYGISRCLSIIDGFNRIQEESVKVLIKEGV